jgi:DNA-binding CsgD family transcriptional regulator
VTDVPTLKDIEPAAIERIFALWDKMTMLEASDADQALRTLLGDLCDLLASKTALSTVAVRMPDNAEHDPAGGWRPRHVLHLHPSAKARANSARAMQDFNGNTRDITIINNISYAGTWRAKRLRELAPPEWFKSDYHEWLYTRMERTDAMWIGCPINADVELYIGIYRGKGQPPFVQRDCDTALFAMRGLRWFVQRYLLSLGLDLATAPLTRTERAILRRMLAGSAQKTIAAQMSQSVYTTHGHIKSIYLKFNVNNRSELMALWLN